MRKARSFARTAASGMIHPAWLHPNRPICAPSISLRVLRYSTAATTSPARSSNDAVFQSPVELAHAPLVVAEDSHALADEEARKRKDLLTVRRPGGVNENDRRVLLAGARLDQRSCQLNGTARETDVFVAFDVDAPRASRRATLALPRQRGNLSGAVALKLDSRLDRGRHGHARPGEEAVAICRIERPNLAGLIERPELAVPPNSLHIWRYTKAFGSH